MNIPSEQSGAYVSMWNSVKTRKELFFSCAGCATVFGLQKWLQEAAEDGSVFYPSKKNLAKVQRPRNRPHLVVVGASQSARFRCLWLVLPSADYATCTFESIGHRNRIFRSNASSVAFSGKRSPYEQHPPVVQRAISDLMNDERLWD